MNTDRCPVCDTCPSVLIAVNHPAMRRLIGDLLDREPACWAAQLLDGDLGAARRELHPDVVIVDGADFPRCCPNRAAGRHGERVVVIGSEPDPAYRVDALRQGADGWVARDDLADGLSGELRRALGCSHGPRPAPLRSRPLGDSVVEADAGPVAKSESSTQRREFP